MLIAGVLCLCAAVASASLGIWTLTGPRTADPTRPRTEDPTRLLLRAMAPTQLAAAVMLAAGGVVVLAAPPQTAALVLVLCLTGAVGTVAAGSWQGARFAAQRESAATACGGDCAACTLSCR